MLDATLWQYWEGEGRESYPKGESVRAFQVASHVQNFIPPKIFFLNLYSLSPHIEHLPTSTKLIKRPVD